MDKYTASNGIVIAPEGPRVKVSCSDGAYPDWHHLSGSETTALREFFRAERDEELGRWRWPENPDYVVYPSEYGCTIIRESDGDRSSWNRGWIGNDHFAKNRHYPAARAYFDAHPERKPWEDAKPGEVWELTVDFFDEPKSTRAAAFIGRDRFGKSAFWFTDSDTYIQKTSGSIIGARRIWPEPSNV